MDSFAASQNDRHPADLAMLRGARLVTASETEEGRAWAESRIKALTGADPITARFMRKDFFTFRPAFKLMIVGNHKPALRRVDDAVRRRFNIVPFDRKPAAPDPRLEERLREEWPAILRWMLEGCADWQANGLVRPEGVLAATEEYFSDQDLLGQWLDEACVVELENLHRWESSRDLFEAWSNFAKAAGDQAGNQKSFGDALSGRGFTPTRGRPEGRRMRGWSGISLRRPGDGT